MNTNLLLAARSAVPAAASVASDGVEPRKKTLALFVAAAADAAQMFLAPVTVEGAASPVELAIDVGVAVLLTVILGWNWRLAGAFAMELVPGATLFPTWTAVVLSLPTRAAAPAAPTTPSALPTRVSF